MLRLTCSYLLSLALSLPLDLAVYLSLFPISLPLCPPFCFPCSVQLQFKQDRTFELQEDSDPSAKFPSTELGGDKTAALLRSLGAGSCAALLRYLVCRLCEVEVSNEASTR